MAHEEDHISDVGSTFDFKGFVLKDHQLLAIGVISIGISLGVAYYNNVRKLPVYQLGNSISIKDDQNPFFTSNTSLTFNWGGTSDKVNTAITILKSRSHNEEVVERLQYYMDYLVDGEYQRDDAYGTTPFKVKVDTSHVSKLRFSLKLKLKDPIPFNLSAYLPASVTVQNYTTKEKKSIELRHRNLAKIINLEKL